MTAQIFTDANSEGKKNKNVEKALNLIGSQLTLKKICYVAYLYRFLFILLFIIDASKIRQRHNLLSISKSGTLAQMLKNDKLPSSASTQLNSTQLQLKLRLRLAFIKIT